MTIIGIVDNNEITDIDRDIEVRLLSHLIYSDAYTKIIHKEFDPTLLQIPEVKDLAFWALEFYKENNCTPKSNLPELINKKKLKFKRFGELHEIVLEAVQHPSENSKENTDYIVKITKEYLLSRSLNNALQQAIELVKERKPYDSISLVKDEIRKTEQTRPDVIKSIPFDKDVFDRIKDASLDNADVLFSCKGALGDFFGTFERGSFICFTGPEKRGKTATLVELAKQALLARLKVTFFSIGDASETQLLKRIYSACTAKAFNRRYFNKPIKYPVIDCLNNQTNECPKAKTKYKVFDGRNLAYDEYKDKHVVCIEKCKNHVPSHWYKEQIAQPFGDFETDFKRFIKKVRTSKWQDNLHVFVFGQWEKTVPDMIQMVDDDEQETGHVPDVIIIDYMDDIDFESGDGLREFRHRNAKMWGKTRGWSIKRNCLILTATQANKESYHMETLTEGVESEDKRKRGYVTAMFGINQTPEEKEQQIIRYNCLARRDAEYFPKQSITVLQCLSIGQASVLSYFRERENHDSQKKRISRKTYRT